MIKIYHNQRCTKSREACSILEKSKVKYEVIEYLKTPPTENEVKSLIKMLGIKAEDLVRKKEPIFKEKYASKKLTETEWIKAMVKYPILIERPIVIKNGNAVIGRPPENIKKLLSIIVILIILSVQTNAQVTPDFYKNIPINTTKSKKQNIAKSDYKVFYKKGNTEVVRAKYKKKFMEKSYYLKASKNKKIYPYQTDSVFRIYGYMNGGDTVKGYLLDKKWIFLTQNGVIKGYADVPGSTIYSSTSFKKGNDSFMKNKNPIKNKALQNWVGDSPETRKLLKKQKRRYLWKIVGSPAIFIGAVSLSVLAKPDSPLAIASWLSSIPLAIIPLTFTKIETAEIVDK